MANTAALLAALSVVVLLVVQPLSIVADDVGDQKHQEISVAKGAVAADDGRCSSIGRDIMKKGGNAMDAAVAVALCQGVVGAGCSGLGGGAFMLIRMADGTNTSIIMREKAPAAANKHMYDRHPQDKHSGGLSIGVPGELHGLHSAWTKFKSGNLDWSSLFQPAIKLAREGYTISPYIYHQFNVDPHALINHTGLCQVYTTLGKEKCDDLDYKPLDGDYLEHPTHYILNIGDTTRNPMLADTLSLIADGGPYVFYNGSIADKLVEDIRRYGGIITKKDFQEYSSLERPPLKTLHPGFNREVLEVLNVAPPTSGGASFVLAMNIFRYLGINLNNMTGGHGRHLYIETMKHVFGVRSNLGDPDFHPEVWNVVKDMLDPEFAEAIARNISYNHGKTYNKPRLYGTRWAKIPDDGTSHFSVVDEQRNAVAMTTSVNWHFGSLILSPSTGIVLNNVMDDFNLDDDGSGYPAPRANKIAARKRPLSSMNPTIVAHRRTGDLVGAFGASGGQLIIPATTRVFLNHFGLGMEPLLECVNYPRVYHTLFPNYVYYENMTTVLDTHIQVPDEELEYLLMKGHILKKMTGEDSQCQIIVHRTESGGGKGNLTAVSDPRKGGYPSGYN